MCSVYGPKMCAEMRAHMKDFNTVDIRNIVLLGGSGSGKTTLTEAAVFASGKRDRLGSVAAGNTVSDYEKEEKERGFSINLSVIPVEWMGCKINLLDTPGGLDFSGERESAASAADAAIIVVNAKRGVDVGFDMSWRLCDRYHLPRLVFVTAMDDDDASYRQVVEDLTERYGSRIAPFHMPVRSEGRLIGYADITRMRARQFAGIGKYEEMEIPAYCMPYLEQFKKILDEAVASADEESMEKYFAGETFSQQEIDCALRSDCIDGTIVPVTMGSGLHVHGVYMLLDCIVRYLPAPSRARTGINVADNEIFDCIYDENDCLVAQVFKTISDPYIGKYSIVKVYSGRLKADSMAFNPSHDTEQKIGRLYYISGDEFVQTGQLVAGDIGAVPKLGDVLTGDTISSKSCPVKLSPVEFERPYTVKRYKTLDKKDDDKVYVSLLKLAEEDQTLRVVNDMENGQQLLAGIGEQQLEITAAKLESKYKIRIELSAPKIAYRETICASVQAHGRYKKQSGGHGQFADVVMTFEPSGNREIPYIFDERVVGGAVPKNFFPAVEKGVEESVRSGLLAGYPVVGLKAVLTDGAAHAVDSSENAFKMAAILAFKEAYLNAKPIILEPIAAVKIYAPAKYTGEIVGDLKTRRARIMGMVPENDGSSYIEADIPMSELDGYLAKLRSISGGYARFEYEFARYGQAPEQITQQLQHIYKNS